jgi:NADPH:quinone reductase
VFCVAQFGWVMNLARFQVDDGSFEAGCATAPVNQTVVASKVRSTRRSFTQLGAIRPGSLPAAISFETGAAMMLKGLTAQYLLLKTLPQGGLKAGDFVLFHAAAGGVGLIACQWARELGLQLIGTAGTDEKCALAKQYGASHAINYRSEDFAARVKDITGGKGVKVVYDSVGADTFVKSLDCLQPFGLAVNFGNASGKVPPMDISILAAKGSLYATRPTIFTHLATRESTQAMANDLFAIVASGQVKIPVEQRYALADVQQAHREMEARTTVGASVLLP